MPMSAAAAGSDDTAVYHIPLKLVFGGKFAVLGMFVSFMIISYYYYYYYYIVIWLSVFIIISAEFLKNN